MESQMIEFEANHSVIVETAFECMIAAGQTFKKRF